MQGREAGVLLAGWPLTCHFRWLPAPFSLLGLALLPQWGYCISLPGSPVSPCSKWGLGVSG